MASVIICSLSIFFLSDTAPSIWGACAEGAYENMYRLGGVYIWSGKNIYVHPRIYYIVVLLLIKPVYSSSEEEGLPKMWVLE